MIFILDASLLTSPAFEIPPCLYLCCSAKFFYVLLSCYKKGLNSPKEMTHC